MRDTRARQLLVAEARRLGLLHDAIAPVTSVMDWHLVQVPPDADELQVVRLYTAAAWRWIDRRHLEDEAPEGSTS